MSLSSYQVEFNTLIGDSNEGTIGVTVAVPSGVTADFYLEILDPLGLAIKSTDTGGAPEFSGTNTTHSFPRVDLPTDANGEYLKGTYTINVYVKNQDSGSGPNVGTLTDTLSYLFCPISNSSNVNSPNLTAKVNCLTGKLIVTDNTNYEGVSVEDYLLTVTPPSVPGVTLYGGTTTEHSLVISLPYTNVSYTASIQGLGIRTSSVRIFDILEVFSLTAFITIPVECNSICELLECANKQMDKLEVKGNAAGGMGKLPADDLNLYLKINSLVSRIGAANICNSCDLESLITELKELVGCDCGCGDSNVPKRLVTLCNSAPGTTNPFQRIDGDGNLFKDTQYLLWEAYNGYGSSNLNVDVTMLEPDRIYHINIQGDFPGLRAIVSPLENIYYQQSWPTPTDVVSFSTSGGIVCHLWVNDGKIYFNNQ